MPPTRYSRCPRSRNRAASGASSSRTGSNRAGSIAGRLRARAQSGADPERRARCAGAKRSRATARVPSALWRSTRRSSAAVRARIGTLAVRTRRRPPRAARPPDGPLDDRRPAGSSRPARAAAGTIRTGALFPNSIGPFLDCRVRDDRRAGAARTPARPAYHAGAGADARACGPLRRCANSMRAVRIDRPCVRSAVGQRPGGTRRHPARHTVLPTPGRSPSAGRSSASRSRGVAGEVGYLQRLAVDPARQRHGAGPHARGRLARRGCTAGAPPRRWSTRRSTTPPRSRCTKRSGSTDARHALVLLELRRRTDDVVMARRTSPHLPSPSVWPSPRTCAVGRRCSASLGADVAPGRQARPGTGLRRKPTEVGADRADRGAVRVRARRAAPSRLPPDRRPGLARPRRRHRPDHRPGPRVPPTTVPATDGPGADRHRLRPDTAAAGRATDARRRASGRHRPGHHRAADDRRTRATAATADPGDQLSTADRCRHGPRHRPTSIGGDVDRDAIRRCDRRRRRSSMPDRSITSPTTAPRPSPLDVPTDVGNSVEERLKFESPGLYPIRTELLAGDARRRHRHRHARHRRATPSRTGRPATSHRRSTCRSMSVDRHRRSRDDRRRRARAAAADVRRRGRDGRRDRPAPSRSTSHRRSSPPRPALRRAAQRTGGSHSSTTSSSPCRPMPLDVSSAVDRRQGRRVRPPTPRRRGHAHRGRPDHAVTPQRVDRHRPVERRRARRSCATSASATS